MTTDSETAFAMGVENAVDGAVDALLERIESLPAPDRFSKAEGGTVKRIGLIVEVGDGGVTLAASFPKDDAHGQFHLVTGAAALLASHCPGPQECPKCARDARALSAKFLQLEDSHGNLKI